MCIFCWQLQMGMINSSARTNARKNGHSANVIEKARRKQ